MGDAALESSSGVLEGAGTANAPYVIDGSQLDPSVSHGGIRISNTRAHLLLQNCDVYRTDGSGIVLRNVENVTVRNCRVSGNTRGFRVIDSQNVKLIGNVAELNDMQGFGVRRSQNVELIDNVAWNNWKTTLEEDAAWGFYADYESTVRGAGNLSSGHTWDVWIHEQNPNIDDASDGRNIFEIEEFTPETSCTRIFEEFFLFIDRAEDAPRLNEPYCSELLSLLRALPVQLRGQIAQFFFMAESREFAGQFSGDGTVRLFDIKNLKAFVSTTFHEIGHVLQDGAFKGNQQSRWATLHRRSGNDPDHYPIQNADRVTRLNDGLVQYAMTNQKEDFASTFEAYTRDTIGMVRRARHIEETTGKTVLLDKIAFVASLFQGQPYAYQMKIDWDSTTGETDLRLQRASVHLEGAIPVIDEDLQWEEF